MSPNALSAVNARCAQLRSCGPRAAKDRREYDYRKRWNEQPHPVILLRKQPRFSQRYPIVQKPFFLYSRFRTGLAEQSGIAAFQSNKSHAPAHAVSAILVLNRYDHGLALKPKLTLGLTFKKAMMSFTKKTFTIIWILGFLLSILASLTNPELVNFAILIVYIIQLFLLLLARPPRYWGIVYRSTTGDGIEGAFARIKDIKQGRQIDVVMSDSKGRFGFKLNKGEYILIVTSEGLKPVEASLPKLTLKDGSIGFKYDTVVKDVKVGLNS